jgi:lipopolysaccharide/colanic/teichoic acid biosynthesis glycosyltransferase
VNRLESPACEWRQTAYVFIPIEKVRHQLTGPVPSLDVRAGWLRPLAESVLAALLLVAALPVLVVAALVIKLTSRGPVIYTQSRVGLGGRPFTIYKLRTMGHNCEATSGIRWATKRDPRVTLTGKLLRVTHLDELPQLWNVIRGDMSLIGPRPERPEIAAMLEQKIPDYSLRNTVRPGVTGLAQIQLPADTDLESVRRKLALDLVYIRKQTSWLDARIVIGTLLKVAATPFPWIRLVLALPVAPNEVPIALPVDHSDETVVGQPILKIHPGASDDTAVDHPVVKAAPLASDDTAIDHPILTAAPVAS